MLGIGGRLVRGKVGGILRPATSSLASIWNYDVIVCGSELHRPSSEWYKGYGIPTPPYPEYSRQQKWDIFEKWMFAFGRSFDDELEKTQSFHVLCESFDTQDYLYSHSDCVFGGEEDYSESELHTEHCIPFSMDTYLLDKRIRDLLTL